MPNSTPAEGIAQPLTKWLNAESLVLLSRNRRRAILESLSIKDLQLLKEEWRFWARPSQLAPQSNWQTWLFLGGRGAGKTRAAAEWVREMVETQQAHSIALIGPTFADVKDVMIEGNSGLIKIATKDFVPKFEASKKCLSWPNGAKAFVYSAEASESLRGPQFDLAWGDEFAAWKDGQKTLDLLRPALRLGENPRMVLTTTPRPVSWVKTLLNDKTCAITKGTTAQNRAFLARGVVENLLNRYEGTIYARQELEGEIIEDPTGALFTRSDIEKARSRYVASQYNRIIITVDPPATTGEKSDACGIIVAGEYFENNVRKAAIIADLSSQGKSPENWARDIAKAYDEFEANFILAEANQGGEMVRTILQIAAPNALVKLSHATTSKRKRAEPIALLYARGLVSHATHFRELEDEMCRFGAQGFSKSPDRLDALVWAINTLLLEANQNPRARTIM